MFSRSLIIFSCLICYTYTATTVKPLSTDNRKCGIVKPGGLIKNITLDANKQSGLGEFPWTVALWKENIITCAGSLILPNIVLTAGHCIKE